jgi:hypothetical protein
MGPNNPSGGCKFAHSFRVLVKWRRQTNSPVAILEQKTILPYPCFSMCGTHSWVNWGPGIHTSACPCPGPRCQRKT